MVVLFKVDCYQTGIICFRTSWNNNSDTPFEMFSELNRICIAIDYR